MYKSVLKYTTGLIVFLNPTHLPSSCHPLPSGSIFLLSPIKIRSDHCGKDVGYVPIGKDAAVSYGSLDL